MQEYSKGLPETRGVFRKNTRWRGQAVLPFDFTAASTYTFLYLCIKIFISLYQTPGGINIYEI
jgi:hypothetical protein